MRELDLILLGWLDSRYAGATVAERAQFEALLELPDPQLAAWLLRAEPPAAEWATLIDTLRSRSPARTTAT